MLNDSKFETGVSHTGFEIEFNLVDERGDPALKNAEVLRAIGDPAFQTELARFNIEANFAPRRLGESGLREFEDDFVARFGRAGRAAAQHGARLVMIGILPTVTQELMTVDALSSNERYRLLNEQIFLARGEDVRIAIDGRERLEVVTDSVAPEAACTSTQLHVQVSPDLFAAYWNAAQAIAGAQVALCANSPFLFGRELWRETRITLFEQSIDTRTPEMEAQGIRPRVWFGERWIDTVDELFAENARYFTPLLPVSDDEDPLEVLSNGGAPRLSELRLHNGTIYRWNRPVYDVVAGTPHLRVENRVLPSGPSFTDTLANAAFWFGLVRRLAEDPDPVWRHMSYQAAEENFFAGARDGLEAELYWPGTGVVAAPELLLRRLLPLAYEGLDRWNVDPQQRDRLLGVIERRCATGVNGAAWQAAVFHAHHDRGGLGRFEALRAMTRRYADLMASGEPVHTWPLR
ncbi:MAG TPA: glutamate-cysteine ligase family protein [Actinopolymorphaceae bacterium]